MDDRKVLFIYDCDGTISGPSVFVWALAKKEGKTTYRNTRTGGTKEYES